MELLKALMTKVSEAYYKLFKTWTRFVIFFVAYFAATSLLPKSISFILMFALLAFMLIAILGKDARTKGPKN